ncbi:MAG TPA: hypothetical protein VHT29_07470 [Solirubrobacteraceae bacterium]|jgi:hypothetical protein|nr:hypothetical protein [Solirubrobacteraceae bacterium]
MPSVEELLIRLVQIAEDQLRWQRVAVLPDRRRTVDRVLDSTKLRRAYEGCDGNTPSGDIAKAAGMSAATFSERAKRWRELGIAYEDHGKRVNHLLSLAALGLPIDIDDKPPH